MRDYWLTKDLLQATGIAFVVLSLIGIGLAITLPKKWWGKLLAVIAVGCVIALPLREARREKQQAQVAVDEYKERYAKAKALFDERCKTAGEKIYKTVAEVEGVLLVNPRPDRSNADRANRDWPGAGFPGESGGNQYIMEFLYFNKPREGLRGRSLGPTPGGLRGYRYVYVDERGERVRYMLRNEAQYSGGSDPVNRYGLRETRNAPAPRYSIVYENINDPEGREQWIAGGSIKVIDQSNDLLAEFKRFSFEAGFGDTRGERSPWAFAMECPQSTYGGSSGHIRSFVEQVLKPKQGE